MEIVPSDKPGTKLMAIIKRLKPNEVRTAIGFDANINEDPQYYGASWAFTVDGVHCGVWYRKSATVPHASGTKEALVKVFGIDHVEWYGP